MSSINEIIKREVNPFDLVNLRTGNFWTEDQDTKSVVESIHQEVITEIEQLLDLVAIDHRSRTALLIGDAGSGKSYLLGRLKRTFNPRAFFAYISPWPDNDYIWRHILRYTVDSLIQTPEGQKESQLILWLKSLSAFTNLSLKQRIFNTSIWQLLISNRQNFIQHLRETYKQAGIYNPDIFFGILYDLTDPELYYLACEWLRGDSLSEESMELLKVRHCIDTEDAAKNILANFGKISTDTQPIVLCFDQLETQPNFTSNPQPIFNINTAIHNDNLKNFLIIISIVKDVWRQSSGRILQSDKARVEKIISLKPINLEQAESLWVYRLHLLHQQAKSKQESNIFPLTRQLLEDTFPGGKTRPRDALNLGKSAYQKYKLSLLNLGDTGISIREKEIAEFKLIWQNEYKKNEGRIGKISLLGTPELIQMIHSSLKALQLEAIKPKLISGNYASYSLSYQQPGKPERIGIVWTEDGNMNSFYHIMNACQRAINNKSCQTLYLIRIGGLGNAKLAGHKIYSHIFKGSQHIHIKPSLASVHYLKTYHELVKSSDNNELLLAGKNINLQKLQSLMRDCEILHQCPLLQDLGVVPKQQTGTHNNSKQYLKQVKDFMLNLVITQGYMAVPVLIRQAGQQFSNVKETDLQHLIDLLCQEKRVKLINSKAKLQDQVISLIV